MKHFYYDKTTNKEKEFLGNDDILIGLVEDDGSVFEYENSEKKGLPSNHRPNCLKTGY